MNSGDLLTSLFLLTLAFVLIAPYVFIVRRKFGIKLNPIQALVFSINTETLSESQKVLEFSLRLLKWFGLMCIITAIVIPIAGR